jgi:hypothetical protein
MSKTMSTMSHTSYCKFFSVDHDLQGRDKTDSSSTVVSP